MALEVISALEQKLARLEMQECVKQLLTHLPNLRLIADDLPLRKHHSLAFSGFERLPLKFDGE